MAQDNENNKAGITDAAIGAGSGAAVAAATSAIYGMTQLKDVKPKEVIEALFKDGEGRAKKIADARQPVLKSLMESDFAKHLDVSGVNNVKLENELKTVLTEHGLDVGGEHKSALEALMKLDYVKSAEEAASAATVQHGIQEKLGIDIEQALARRHLSDEYKPILDDLRKLDAAPAERDAALKAVLEKHGMDVAGQDKALLEELAKLDFAKPIVVSAEQQKLKAGIEAVLKEHAIEPATQEAVTNALTESRFAAQIQGPHVDVEKLQAGIEAALTKQGFDVKGLKEGALKNVDFAKELTDKLTSQDAAKLFEDLQKSVAEAVKVNGISSEGMNAILGSVTTSAKGQTIEPLLDALKEHGSSMLNIDADKVKEAWKNAHAGLEGLVKEHVDQLMASHKEMVDSVTATIKSKLPTADEVSKIVEEAGNVKDPKDVAAAMKGMAAKMGKVTDFTQVVPDITNAAVSATSFPGKTTEERVKFLTRSPKEIAEDAKNTVVKAFADNKVDLKGEAKGFAMAADDAARKLIGGTKYKFAQSYEKPLVAFDAMPIKGKVALGAAVVATTAIGTMLSAGRHNSHAEAVQNSASGQTAQVG